MKSQIKEILFKNGKLNASKNKESYFSKNYIEIYNEINKIFNFKITFIEKLYLYLNDLDSQPLCKECNNNVKFNSITKGYNIFCSKNCSNVNSETKNKIFSSKETIYGIGNFVNPEKGKLTKKIKYGDENYNNREKASKTVIEKYGVEHTSHLDEVKHKMKETCILKYGTEFAIQSEEVRDKVKKTFINKYGVDSPFKIDSIKLKIKNKFIENYGVDNPNKSQLIISKRKRSNVKNYGVEHGFQSELIKNKIKDFYIKNFNVEYPLQVAEIKNKSSLTYNQRYYDLYSTIVDFEIVDNGDLLIKNHCPNHPEFTIDKGNFYQRHFKYKIPICTKCNPLDSNSSIREKMIGDFLNELNVSYSKCDRQILNGKELDYYLPDYNLAIEYNGYYYHSDLFRDKNYHLNKTKECEIKNIKLLHIWEHDYINKKDIIESIIRNKLNKTENKIFARKCNINTITSEECKNFLSKNHLQGNVVSKYRYGLYYRNELVSVITFGKLRKNLGLNPKDNCYELLRFCNKLNFSVVGAFSKLLKHFEKNIQPKEILTYANRDISDGNVYNKNEFTFIKETKPGYSWVKNGTVYNRFSLRKNKLVEMGYDINKTEDEILKENGYLKVWNSGNLKFIKYFN